MLSKSIPSKASEITGLSVKNGQMFSNGEAVQSTSIDTALRDFLKFLRKQGDSIILVAHNCFK